MLNNMHKKNQAGFTLVELMIVVAIIGILAAIAIPQFAEFRIRAFNTAAISDAKNTITAQAALIADWQRVGTTQATAGGAFVAVIPTVGATVLGGDANGDGLSTVDNGGNFRGTVISVSNGVSILVLGNTIPTQTAPAATYQIVAKHLSGDTTYAMDAESANVYQNVVLLDPAEVLTNAEFTTSVAANTVGVDDIGAVGGDWIVR